MAGVSFLLALRWQLEQQKMQFILFLASDSNAFQFCYRADRTSLETNLITREIQIKQQEKLRGN